MKKAAAIALMVIYILGSTNACQVLKLPLLVTHYIKHKKESPYMTFRSFFKMHYLDPQPFDDDYAQDMQLPFKSTPDTFLLNRPSVKPAFPALGCRPPASFPVSQLILNDRIPLFTIASKIFQPPKA